MGFFDKVENFFSGVADDIGGAAKWTVTNVEDEINKTESSFTGFLSTPLIIISVGIAYMLYNSNVGQVADAAKNAGPLIM